MKTALTIAILGVVAIWSPSSAMASVYVDTDFNGDGISDIADLDLLSEAIVVGDEDLISIYDMDGDGQLTSLDIVEWTDEVGVPLGDVNFDGVFDSTDLLLMFAQGEYEDGISGNSTYSEGDMNGDGEFDSSDLLLLMQ